MINDKNYRYSNRLQRLCTRELLIVLYGIYDDVDAVVETINQFGKIEMWNDLSPIWLRPQYSKMKLYKPRKLLQVVGHTPMTEITRTGNLISTDVFSTDRNGTPIGTEEFLLLDTVTWEYDGINMHMC